MTLLAASQSTVSQRTHFAPYRPSTKERIEIVKITPEIAQTMLRANKSNRPLSRSHVESAARSLRLGEFPRDYAPLRFDKNGILLDGQHRLHAIIETGISIETVVVFGLPPEIFIHLDKGRRRTSGDDLAMRGYCDTNALASAAALLWRYDQGVIQRSHVKPGRPEVDQVITENPGLDGSLRFVRKRTGAGNLIPRGTAAFLHYAFSRADAEKADDFFHLFSSGADLGVDHPILKLRNRMVANSLTKTAKLNREVVIALAIKAWLLFRKGMTCRQLSFRVGDEDFPVIR